MKIHLVKKGETLFHIAKKYGIELQKLISFNTQIADPDQIDVGTKVKIPSAPVPVPPPVGDILHKHVVVQGDSLWKLSKAWDVPLKAVIDANPHLKNPNVLMTGEVVYIPKLGTDMPHEGVQEGAPMEAVEPMEGEAPAAVPGPEEMTEAVPGLEEAAPAVPGLEEAAEVAPSPQAQEPVAEAADWTGTTAMTGEVPINDWTGMQPLPPGYAESAEPMFPHTVVGGEQEEMKAEFPFAQYHIPATEAMMPQPSLYGGMPQAPYAFDAGKAPTYSPMPSSFSLSYESVQLEHMPAGQPEGAWPFMDAMPAVPGAVMPAVGEKYPGISSSSAAPCAGAPMPYPVSPAYQQQPGFGLMPEAIGPAYGHHGYGFAPEAVVHADVPHGYDFSPSAAVPCHPCQGHGIYPPAVHGVPYAMPFGAYPASYSPHSAWAQKEDCGCGDDRTGDISSGSAQTSDSTRSPKGRGTKAAISTARTKAPKRRPSPAPKEKKQNQPWIRA
ncbi:LysM peptidoglycan-binding domain-containing protein [Paenibacillus flagellatus]|uniref:LysM peptidoglycan-binding domain-containing protein n=1 Tax=Paenibacillus flagellatus TaxID=2211139 RepID=UPI001FE31895|nr:LysM peptidoglycan-binding domain-containing protein [Paenibacillus flagellatus]